MDSWTFHNIVWEFSSALQAVTTSQGQWMVQLGCCHFHSLSCSLSCSCSYSCFSPTPTLSPNPALGDGFNLLGGGNLHPRPDHQCDCGKEGFWWHGRFLLCRQQHLWRDRRVSVCMTEFELYSFWFWLTLSSTCAHFQLFCENFRLNCVKTSHIDFHCKALKLHPSFLRWSGLRIKSQ